MLTLFGRYVGTISATRPGLLPKARLPITTLSGLVFTSATGAKSRLKPYPARYVPMVRPAS